MKKTEMAIFASGNGSNCENIISYFKDVSNVNIALVITNRPDAYVLTRAAHYGVPSTVIDKKQLNDPNFIIPLLKKYRVNFIVLAGFLAMIPEFLTKRYDHRMVNIHPSLLPLYGGKGMYGHHVHEAVKAAGDKETGITIHYVNSRYDEGDIIAQFSVPLSPDDTIDDIRMKVHFLELKHFPEVIKAIL